MPWTGNRPREFIRLLAQAVDAKGEYFPGHSDGVAYLARMMATEAEFAFNEVRELEICALLHDVGKVMIPDQILRKTSRLNETEFEVMRHHPVWSAEITQRLERVEFAVPVVLSHHEHFDGSGYPRGLKGEEIPFYSRIILVADAFHVMTNDRPYTQAISRIEALKELDRYSGTQFCPQAVQLLRDRDAHHNLQVPKNEPHT